ncbi:MAG: HD domain-containing protein [Ichthyobacteriaceae bacterium]|nr:HD domain-containing protein [Ichthyobacteriaceae bacterium]
MNKQEILDNTRDYIRAELSGDGTGHDWWHIHRVIKIAMQIGVKEKADLFIVELGAMLHDLGDFKFHNGDTTVGPRMVKEWLVKQNATDDVIKKVVKIVEEISYKGANVDTPMSSFEGKVVQDADRLDAMGAIGIARAFAYGGSKGREMHNPSHRPKKHNNFDAYKNSKTPTINHFYEKLLLLKDRMNTETAINMAQQRHAFMLTYLDEFYNEWDCDR